MTRTPPGGRHRAGDRRADQLADRPEPPPARAGAPGPPSPGPSGPPADPELLAAVRAGDTAAFGVLYHRHREAARRLARALARDPSDAEDLVAEAVAKVLAALRAGRGPEVAFRAYLLTAVRHAGYDRARRDRRVELAEDLSRYESAAGGAEPGDPALSRLERSYAARAFAKLPERWRMVLWHTVVEGEKPAAVATLLGLSPNAVAALAYRARERLRQMYLQEHLGATDDPACHWTAGRLGAYVRGGLAGRECSKVDSHLAACPDCQRLRAELAEENSGLRGVLGPLVLGPATTPYLATLPDVAWWEAVAGPGRLLLAAVQDGWSALGRWWRAQLQRYGPGNVAAAAGVAVAALAGIGMFALALVLGPDGPDRPGQPERPPAAGPPVPAPAPVPPSEPAPSGPPGGSPTPAPADRVPAGAPGGAAPAPPAPPRPDPVPPEPPGPVVVAPDLAATTLAAGAPGKLAIQVSLPGAQAGSTELIMEATPDRPGNTRTDQVVELAVGWPEGITLTGADAGEGWRCAAEPAGARCRRAAWPDEAARTARLPVSVAETLGGFAPVEISVTAGDRRGRASARVPVAPVGLRVGYAVNGRYRLAMAGNTWLSCPDRPECLAADPLDNNYQPMAPYLPGGEDGGPVPPPGLPGPPVAASGAALPLPAGAEVAWAGLTWAATGTEPPGGVQVHAPGGGGWQPVAAERVRAGEGAPVRQAYADLTRLVRAGGGGAWWLAAGTGLPAGKGASAGWSLTVVYADPDAPPRDLAVFTDPVLLAENRPRMAYAHAPGGEVEVGLVLWEGDRERTGDSLRLDRRSLGDPVNLASSRADGALECGGAPARGCGWHTFGVDVARHRGTAGPGPDGGTVSLHTRADRLQVGVLALAASAPR